MNTEIQQLIGLVVASCTLAFLFWLFTSYVNVGQLFSSPIGVAIVPDPQCQSNPSVNLLSGALRMFSLYFVVSIVIALSGGTIGSSIGATLTRPPDSGELKLMFVSGLLATSLARIAAVYDAGDFASYLLYLAIWLAAGAVYLSISNFTLAFFQGVNYSAFPNAILWAVLATAIVCSVTELAVSIRSDSRVKYALLSERIEQQATIRQIFGAKRVVDDTDRIIADEVEKQGLTELLWITNEPPPHFDSLLRGLEKHGESFVTEESRVDFLSLIRDNPNVRVIHGPKCRSIRNLSKYIPEYRRKESPIAFRVRFMVLNRRLVIVHLPMPFFGEDGERANTLHVIKSPPQVAIWRNKFLTLERILELDPPNSGSNHA